MAKQKAPEASLTNFSSMLQAEVPQSRNGKHREIVSKILADLDKLEAGRALKIPLAQLPDSKENVRSALNRVTRQRRMNVSTASDEMFLYVWQPDGPGK